MGVPNSEVGYTPAMPRWEDHEVHKDMWWHWTTKQNVCVCNVQKYLNVKENANIWLLFFL